MMDGNRYRVAAGINGGFLLVPETVTFNGNPGTPVEHVQGLADVTGSGLTIARPLYWGRVAFLSAVDCGAITYAE